jgi:hypothetical protein
MSPWQCLCCGAVINPKTGRSLADDGELNLCNVCWGKMSVAQQLETVRRWRLVKAEQEALETFAQVCRGAMDGFHVPPMGEAGRN